MNNYPMNNNWPYLLLALFITTITCTSAEAGLLSGLAKLGKKIDVPDTHVSSLRFVDELAKYPEGSAAELSFSYSQNRWLAKTADGQSIPAEQFAADVSSTHKQATLLLSERNLPPSLDTFKTLPAGVDIKIKTSKGKTFSLKSSPTAMQLIDQNISVAASDIVGLKTALWQLQRPLMSPKMRLVQLADHPDLTLPKQNYGSKIPVDAVGSNQLLNAISSVRQQTMVISAKVENGFLVNGKQKIAIADLEQVAADRDVSLIILNSDKPKQTLQQLAKDWQQRKEAGVLMSYTTGDFYNAFAPKNTSSPIAVDIEASGQLRTALQFDHNTPTKTPQTQASDIDLALLPLHIITRSVTLLRPNEARSEELDNRIHPLLPSWVHMSLIGSLLIGLFMWKTSWFLYLKLWASPLRANYSNGFYFTFRYLFHRLSFLLLYLPLLGFISPIYLIAKWTYLVVQFLLIRPVRWLFSKFV